MDDREMTTQTIVVRTDNVLSAALDEELILLSIDQNKYFGSGTVGRRIWDLLESPMSVGSLVAQLLTEFEVDEGECLRATQAFLSQLIDANLATARSGTAR